MHSKHRSAERLAELTREVGAVLSKVDDMAIKVIGGLKMSSNGDGQPGEFSPEEHKELRGLAPAMLIRLAQTMDRIKPSIPLPPPPQAKLSPSLLRLA